MKNHALRVFFARMLCMLLILAGNAWQANTQTHVPRNVNVTANCGGFYEYLPANYAASTKKFPLLISFHGAGSYGNGTTDLNKVLRENAAYYININQFPSSFTVNGEAHSFIVISPQWKDYASVGDINALIDYLLAQSYKIDAGRIYLMGYSMGGDQIIKYVTNSSTNASRIAGMVTIAPYINPYTDAGANIIANTSLPFWGLHSNADQTSPVSWSVSLVNKINSFNPSIPAILTRFDGVTHVNSGTYASNPAYKVGGYNIYEWMLRYRRNYPPIANAGPDQFVSLPTTNVTLNGNASTDPEGSALSYNWQKLTGPGSQNLSSPGMVSTAVEGLVAGTYQFMLTVTDAAGLFDRDTIRIVVTNPNPNQLPIANAGADITIQYPASSVTLNGTNSHDNDGVLVAYQWTKIAGPNSFAISGATTATPLLSLLRKGIYVMQLTVTDNENGTARDTVVITVVNPNPNVAPVANAGPDQVITLPNNSVTLNGSASFDADGEVVQYEWRQVTGPAQASVTGANTVQVDISNLQQGSYQFELAVTDDSAAVALDTVRVTVNPPPPVITNQIKVNLFSGANPQTTEGWNNWNLLGSKLTNRNSGPLFYANGNSSSISATLSYSEAVSDNGASFGGTMCPPAVLRYTSYATISRTLTINGLAAGKTYGLELYASRNNSGNSTRFTINGVTQSVLTDNNKTDKVVFNNLTSTNGTITVTIARANTYTYLNGFMLTETTAVSGNLAPVANAGSNVSLVLPANAVSLSGAASYDQDGSIVSYAWSKISGPASFSISNPNIVNPVISNLEAGTYEMQLMVTDNSGAADLDTMQVTVFPPEPLAPTANAGSDAAFTLPLTSFTLNGSASSDVDGTISSYHWEQFEGPAGSFIINANQAIATVENPLTGRYGFELTVTDNDGLLSKDSVFVTIGHNPFEPPSITDSLNCGKQVRIVVMGSSTAMGTGASVPDSNWVNKFKRYVRSFNAASEVINLATSSRTTYHLLNPNGFIPPVGRPEPDTLRNITKALSYNPDIIIINLPSNDVALNYTLAEQQANYERTMALADAAGITVWVTTTQPRTAVNTTQREALKQVRDWTYMRFGNKAIDFWTTLANDDGSIADIYNVDGIHVNDMGHHLLYTRVVGKRLLDTFCLAANLPPVVNAGTDQVLVAPVSTILLSGSATDADGTIVDYAWRQIAGPTIATIDAPTSASTAVQNLQLGTYGFEFSATDNHGATRRDSLLITVKRGANEPPLANAGNDTSISLPTSSVQLRGVGSDPDGTIVSYTWRQVSGPAAANFSATTITSPIVSGLMQGIYLFELTVTDDSAATATDVVAVQVNARPNTAPVVDAGNNVTITLPVNTVQLNGSVFDAESNVQTISWTQQSGPAGAIIATPGTAVTSVSNLVQGSYLFKLTAVDDAGAAATDSVWVTVNSEPTTTSRFIKVNIFGGVNPQTTEGWNNWNLVGSKITNRSSGALLYDDGSASSVVANLSYSEAISDNGATFGGTMCPPAVLRYTSYATVNRTLTLNGLNAGNLYDIELFASRNNTGNSTRFTINGISQTVSTDNNKINKVVFTNLSASNGTIAVTVARVNTYSYINGFVIIETAPASPIAVRSVQTQAAVPLVQQSEVGINGSQNAGALSFYPNPITAGQTKLVWKHPYKGLVTVQLRTSSGILIEQSNLNKLQFELQHNIQTAAIPAGNYWVVLIADGIVLKRMILKLNQ